MMFKTFIFAVAVTAIAATPDDPPSLMDILRSPESTSYPKGRACTPGANFQYYCNTCTCLSTGDDVSCTRRGCPPGIFEEDGSLRLPETSKVKREVEGDEDTSYPKGKSCTPGAKFQYYCNTCTCSSTGDDASCTRMGCPRGMFNEDGSLRIPETPKVKREVGEPEDTLYPKGKACTPGAKFQYYCNTCTCSSTGDDASCTRMGCPRGMFNEDGSLRIPETPKVKREVGEPEDTLYPKGKSCKPGAKFQYYCNTCTCSSTGDDASCTRMGCPRGMFNEDGSLKVSETPKVKREVKVDEIRELPADGSCTPGHAYKRGCNVCSCFNVNEAVCTLMECLTEPSKKRRSVEKWGPRYEPGSECTPNTQFYSECNECTCLSNGKNAACTLMACDPASRPQN